MRYLVAVSLGLAIAGLAIFASITQSDLRSAQDRATEAEQRVAELAAAQALDRETRGQELATLRRQLAAANFTAAELTNEAEQLEALAGTATEARRDVIATEA